MVHHVLLERNESVCEVILNRPPVNALNEELVNELGAALQQVEKDKDVRVVIIRSAVSSFVAGADIKMMEEIQSNQETGRMLSYLKGLQNTLTYLENMQKPTIAYISGHAMGGGLELALACDFRIMTKNDAKIGLPELKLGMFPGAGGPQRLTRIVGEAKAKDLIYFSRLLSAEEALSCNIVTHVVSPEGGLNKVYEIAKELSKKAPVALAAAKRCIQSAAQESLVLGSEKELMETAIVFNSEDAKIGFKAFLDKKEPLFIGK
jgi:enoyl-CoA hydratase